LAVDDSFAQTSQKIEELFGQKVSERTVERVVHQVGSVVLEQQNQELESFSADRQIPQSEANPERLYLAVDGTTAHETDGWHEVKVSAAFTGRMRALNALDVMSAGLTIRRLSAGIFGSRLVGAGCGRLKKSFFSVTVRRGFVMNAASILVVPLSSLIGITPANTSGIAVKCFLWDGQTRKLLKDLQKQHKRHRGRKREKLAKLHKYIQDNEQEMRYDVFREKGYDIGSGAVEGACKHVVPVIVDCRLTIDELKSKIVNRKSKIHRAGSSATLALRITWLNKRWDKLWSQKPLAA